MVKISHLRLSHPFHGTWLFDITSIWRSLTKTLYPHRDALVSLVAWTSRPSKMISKSDATTTLEAFRYSKARNSVIALSCLNP